MKDELIAIGNRKDELKTQLKTADEPPPLLHPSMADLYRSKVEELAAALQLEDTRLEASEVLRGADRSDCLDSAGWRVADRAERESGRDVGCRPTNEKVARNGRPSHAGTVGCGGPQQVVPAALLGGSVNVKTLAFLTEVPDVRSPMG